MPRFTALLAAPNARTYLWVGILVSVALHLCVLVLHLPPRPRPATPAALDVIVVNSHTDHAPVNAQAQAQDNLDGGGTAQRGYASAPLPYTGESAQQIILEALHKRQEQLEAEQRQLLTQLTSRQALPTPTRQAQDPKATQADPGEDDTDQPAVMQNPDIAALAAQVQAYNAQPRVLFVGPSTRASPYAAYLGAWQSHVERIGTEHFPPLARGGDYDSVQVTVYVRADGRVVNVEIDRPSTHAELNQAVSRIVNLAAPFAPFPPELARKTDILAITRTWHFVNGTLETQSQ